MSEEEKKFEEDSLTGLDIDDEDADELQNAEFVDGEIQDIKVKVSENEKISQFLDENNKIIAEKIIEKKTGAIIEVKYRPSGQKESIITRDKQKRIRRAVDYHENGVQKLVTDYNVNGGYKSMLYNPDGTRVSYVIKHKDGTADAVHYNADGKGNNLVVKMDANKEVIEKRIEKD